MKNFFKGKPSRPQTPTFDSSPTPRTMEEINKTYSELCGRAGQLQYQIKVNTEQLEEINTALKSVNHEANARQKLDAEALDKKEEVASV